MKRMIAVLTIILGFSTTAFADNTQNSGQQGSANPEQATTAQQPQQTQQNENNNTSSPDNDVDPEADQR